jgi:protein-tyrosine-phosphatase
LEVHVAWCPANAAALRSKYARRFHPVPAYRTDGDEWLVALNDLLREQQFDLVIPCSDGAILPLQLHRAALICPERICLLTDDSYRICASKNLTYLLAQRLGIPLPAQAVASTLGEVRAAAADFGYPLVLKPRSSSSALNSVKRRVVQKAAGPEDLEAKASAMLAEDAILVQQNFSGTGVGVEVLCKDGRVLVAFQHERVHEPLEGGGSSYRKSVPLHPGMLEATRRMMQELRYTGVAMAEYKYNPATGAWVLLEINARFWGSLPLCVAAGMDFPRYLYEMWCEGRERFPQEYAVNRYCRNLTADLQWTLANLSAERGDANLKNPPLRRAAEGIRRARSVAFVCYGNICRSPFAAAVVRRLRPDLVVSSFGYYPKEERESPADAEDAARRMGVDLSGHRSRLMTQANVDAADVILVFDRKDHDNLLERFSGLEGKLHYWGALDVAGPLEIADPYGSPAEEFVKCYERIRRIGEMYFGHGAKAGTGSGSHCGEDLHSSGT